MNTIHATIEEFVAEGYTHVECFCPAVSSDTAAADELATPNLDGPYTRCSRVAARCAEGGGPLPSVKPWRQAGVIGKTLGRRG